MSTIIFPKNERKTLIKINIIQTQLNYKLVTNEITWSVNISKASAKNPMLMSFTNIHEKVLIKLISKTPEIFKPRVISFTVKLYARINIYKYSYDYINKLDKAFLADLLFWLEVFWQSLFNVIFKSIYVF